MAEQTPINIGFSPIPFLLGFVEPQGFKKAKPRGASKAAKNCMQYVPEGAAWVDQRKNSTEKSAQDLIAATTKRLFLTFSL